MLSNEYCTIVDLRALQRSYYMCVTLTLCQGIVLLIKFELETFFIDVNQKQIEAPYIDSSLYTCLLQSFRGRRVSSLRHYCIVHCSICSGCAQGIEHVNLANMKWCDMNVVSSLLKLFFRKLPTSLIPEGSRIDYSVCRFVPVQVEFEVQLLVQVEIQVEVCVTGLSYVVGLCGLCECGRETARGSALCFSVCVCVSVSVSASPLPVAFIRRRGCLL